MLPLAASEASGMSSVAAVLAVAAALILAAVLAEVVVAVLRRVGRRRWLPAHLSRRVLAPVAVLLAALFLQGAVGLVADRPGRGFVVTTTVVALAAATWLLAVVVGAGTDAALQRHRMDTPGRRHARGSAALARLVRRVGQGLVVVLGVAAVLLVIDGTRPAGLVVLGAWLLGLAVLAAGVVPWLRDVAAGLQLALTDAVRLDDVLAVDGEWGRVEEITATSVLLQAWDDRRVVVPTRRLTAAAFENWTRRSSDPVGSVELDVDAAVPVPRVRAELVRLVERNDLWDRRVAVLQVVGATGDRVRLRATVSAADAPRLQDLRCDVLEALVEWLRVQGPTVTAGIPVRARHGESIGVAIGSAIGSALEHTHVRESASAVPGAGSAAGSAPAEVPETTARLDPRRDARLFTGSVFAVERSRAFTGPGADVLAERDAAGEG